MELGLTAQAPENPAITSDGSQSHRDWPMTFVNLTIHKPSEGPIAEQILQTLRDAIMARELPPGTMFPPSREFAEALGLGRNTVVRVYARLVAEGHVVSNTRRGTRVAPAPYTVSSPPTDCGARRIEGDFVDVGFNGKQLLDGEKKSGTGLSVHEPDPSLYPRHALGKLIAEEFRHPPEDGQRGAYSRANLRLQYALARHLRLMRGVCCEPEQIIPTSGFEAAMALTTKAMIDPGHCVHLENPTFKSVRDVLRAAGVNLHPLALSGHGAQDGTPPPRMIFVSPSVNFPFGHQMAVAHRHALLGAARNANALIFESDIGAELIYSGERRQAIQGEDRSGRVIYYGSLSETLGPHIRMGYLVVPPHLVEAFTRIDFHAATSPSPFIQSAVARYIEESRYAVHVKQVRQRYAERARLLFTACRMHLPDVTAVAPGGGLHMSLLFSQPMDEAAVCEALGDTLSLTPLSQFYLGTPEQSGLVLGFGTLLERAIEPAVKSVANAIRYVGATV